MVGPSHIVKKIWNHWIFYQRHCLCKIFKKPSNVFFSCLKLPLILRYVGISDSLNVNISILWVCTCATFEVAAKSGVLSWPHNFFGSYFHLPPYLGPACVFCLGRSLCWLCLGKHSDLFVTELVLLAPSLMSCHPNSNSNVMLSIEES